MSTKMFELINGITTAVATAAGAVSSICILFVKKEIKPAKEEGE